MADPWKWLGDDPSEMAMHMRRVDWSATSVGPVEAWPASLRTLITTMLRARQPMFLWWGPDLIQFYNDGYVPSFGVGRHPAALGQRGEQCWTEIWSIIGPEIAGVRETGQATFHEDALVPIFRNGRMEEVYWTYGYSPVLDEGGMVAGVLVVVTETTTRVVARRRLQTARVVAEAGSIVADHEGLAIDAVRVLAEAPQDAPWTLVYRAGHNPDRAALVASTGLDDAQSLAVMAAVQRDSQRRSLNDPAIIDLTNIAGLPGTPWPEPSTTAVTLAIPTGATSATYTFVLGLSPRLPYDGGYEDHAAGMARQLKNAAQRITSQNASVAAEGARDSLLMQAPVAAALLVGSRWRYDLANTLYEKMVGRAVVGRDWRACFPELIGGPVEGILQRVYDGGETFFASEQLVPLARESDSIVEERFFDFNMIPIRAQTGAVEAMMVVAVEMTTQVRARRELEQTAVERESLVERLEAASRAKDEFLAMMGHELRNPLAPMVTALALLSDRGASGREHEVIARQVSHLTRLVDDLLDVSRLTSAKIELRRSLSAVTSIVDAAIEVVASLFEQRRHVLETDVEPGLRWNGDATRLQQVLANLLTNAARYTPPGGHVRLTAEREQDLLVIRVRDNGRGIAADLLPRLFDPFVQASGGRDHREGGLGLGLAIVRGLTALHGGTVQAQSEGVDQGSVFTVRLPGLVAETTTSTGATAIGTPRTDASRPKRVLLVDDNRDAVDLTAEVFRLAGHDVLVAYDGPSALELVDKSSPEIAVLDIGLPVMDGYELVRRLRERETGSRCRYFALTGYGQKEDIARAYAAGFERLLVKPVAVDVLLRVVAETWSPE